MDQAPSQDLPSTILTSNNMRFTPIILSTLLTITSAAPLTSTLDKRDAASIVSAIQFTQANVATLNQTLNTFEKGQLDGLLKVLKIQKQSSDVGKAVDATIQVAEASEPLNGDDSFKVADATLKLQPDLESFLKNLASKKDAFDSILLGLVSVSPQILKTLRDQKAQSRQLGAAVTAKLASPFKDFAPLVTDQISGYFDDAIEVFSTGGGIIALPPLPLV